MSFFPWRVGQVLPRRDFVSPQVGGTFSRQVKPIFVLERSFWTLLPEPQCLVACLAGQELKLLGFTFGGWDYFLPFGDGGDSVRHS